MHLYSKPAELLKWTCSADTAIVHELEPPVDMQFIFSRDDTIIDGALVENYIAEVASRPSRKGMAPPRTLIFDQSKHVFHKILYKDQYYKATEDFSLSVLAI